MQTRYIPAVITLLAGAVISIITIIKGYEVLYSLQLLLAVLVVFYIIGLIAKKIIVRAIESEKEEEIEADAELFEPSEEEVVAQESEQGESHTGDDEDSL